jgi:hypothetical protein
VTLLNFDVRFTSENGHSHTRSGCLLGPIFVAKRFLASERRTLFLNQARIENFDSRIRLFGFYYCPFWRSGGLAATFATKSANSGQRTAKREVAISRKRYADADTDQCQSYADGKDNRCVVG